jgi:small-conductance mechanosensitive channel
MYSKRRFTGKAAVLLAGPISLGAVCAAALGADETPVSSMPYEASLMIIAVTGIVLLGILVTRVLLRLRVIKNLAWMMPIMGALAGAAWAEMLLARYQGVDNLRSLVRFLFLFMLFVSMLYVLARLVLPSAARRTRAGVPSLIRNLAVLVLALLGLFILLMWSFPKLSLTPVFVTSGVASIIIGLAVQDLLSNLVAGVVLSVERPFEVGQWIQIGDAEGEVVEVGWRATRIRNRQNDYLEVPNNVIARERLVNFDLPTPLHLRRISVGVTYDTPPGLAVQALLEAASKVQGVLPGPPPDAYFKDYQDFSLLYELRVWIDNYASAPAIESDVRKEIWYAFKRQGITIPFPIRDVNLRQVVEQPLKAHARLVAGAGLPRGTMFDLEEGRLTIGRDPANRICINDQHVSNEHAIIEWQDNRFLLRDLGSRHGTVLNGDRVQSAYLEQGDEITVGPVTLVYESNLVPASASVRHAAVRKAPAGDGPGGPPASA